MRISRLHKLIVVAISFLLLNGALNAQSTEGRVAFGADFGASKYWGSFTDNRWWIGGDVYLRWNIFKFLSLHAIYGLTQLQYKVNEQNIISHPDYFGPLGGGVGQGTYPQNSNIRRNELNMIRVNTYGGFFSFNILPSQRLVPYVFGGVEMMNFEPRNKDQNIGLPNNQANVYEKNKLIFPMGLGLEVYATDDLVLNFKGQFHITGTDYLDDYQDAGTTSSDVFGVFSMGVGLYIFGTQDCDGDGLADSFEREIKTDPCNPDTDGDGLNDYEEVKKIASNPLKADTDDDGVNDFDEVRKYMTNATNPDTDSDGLKDGQEVARKTDPKNPDTDNDGLTDGDEVNKYSTEPTVVDTDGDGLNDGDEVKKYSSNPTKTDSDGDGLNDGVEVQKYNTNPASTDSDNDGLSDGEEINTYKSDPSKSDTDGDGLSDGDEIKKYNSDPLKTDSDGDGLSDGDEVKTYQTNPKLTDSDGDGLKDGDEVNTYKTNPAKADSDDDKLPDGEEVLTYKSDPTKTDTDGDGLSDGDEVKMYTTDPTKADTDGDRLTDGDEVNRTKTNPTKPDTDGDTIIDSEDECPLLAGLVEKKGCPGKVKIGTIVNFPEILFIVNTDEFDFTRPQTSENLAKLLSYVNQCPNIQVMIEGHASREGNEKRNQQLSEMRANKVRAWLVSQGVPATRVQGAIGYGSRVNSVPEPAPNSPEAKKMDAKKLEDIRKQNRRIAVKVVKGCDD